MMLKTILAKNYISFYGKLKNSVTVDDRFCEYRFSEQIILVNQFHMAKHFQLLLMMHFNIEPMHIYSVNNHFVVN